MMQDQTMDVKGIRRRRTEPGNHSALLLAGLGFVVFAQGMIYLVDDARSPDRALGAFKLAGWFATAGWLLGHLHRPQSTLAKWVRLGFLRVQAFCRIPAD